MAGKIRIRIMLKNGQSIPVLCEKCDVTMASLTGKLIDCKISNHKGPYPFYLDTDEVVAIIREGKVDEEE